MELQTIKNKIYEIRNQKVILDFDLSALYETETRALKQAVNRNMDRFPEDFMFQLTKTEWSELITKSDNLSPTAKFSPSRPYAFTEQGVAMISSVLKSKKAIEVNISIMRAFVLIRQYALSHRELTDKLQEMEARFDQQFSDVYEALTFLMDKNDQETNQKQREKIGYKITS
ncbi:ORF6N domain-containing protein [Pedobacter sp. KR3-3]|uniref:ORF6N domain-containing protein n=1 Tax=Pedobacter albus TaxID=3113905 RepID=A0ABU7ICI6_9SPHI|nr:ORF6N domain-containing protein [Pedobacter sp. KR3-3]MEE1947200.1 ORF6N domain-containing protein [Pedobacter sp. KR3-3]